VTPEAAEVAAGIAAEADRYEDVPDGPLPKGSPRLADVLAGQREALCDALMAAAGGTSPAQLAEETGMSESTVYVWLGRLTEAGALTKVQRGLWAAVPGADVHAAMARVEARDSALKTEAKAMTRRSRIHAA
jgi:DNA-binding transcriptional ArsR family regulator